MNDTGHKSTTGEKSKRVKNEANDARYMQFRSYTPKRIESKIASYMKIISDRVKTGTSHKINSPRSMTITSKKKLPATNYQRDSNSGNKSISGQRQIQSKKEPLSVSNPRKNTMSGQRKTQPKKEPSSRNENTRSLKTQVERKQIKEHSTKQSKKHRTFDISTFPRIFSTSDLMKKMSESSAGEIEKMELTASEKEIKRNLSNSANSSDTKNIRYDRDRTSPHFTPKLKPEAPSGVNIDLAVTVNNNSQINQSSDSVVFNELSTTAQEYNQQNTNFLYCSVCHRTLTPEDL